MWLRHSLGTRCQQAVACRAAALPHPKWVQGQGLGFGIQGSGSLCSAAELPQAIQMELQPSFHYIHNALLPGERPAEGPERPPPEQGP